MKRTKMVMVFLVIKWVDMVSNFLSFASCWKLLYFCLCSCSEMMKQMSKCDNVVVLYMRCTAIDRFVVRGQGGQRTQYARYCAWCPNDVQNGSISYMFSASCVAF